MEQRDLGEFWKAQEQLAQTLHLDIARTLKRGVLMHEKLMGWLKDHGWRCVRDGDFFADFEKPTMCGNRHVSVPLWKYSTTYDRKIDEAISIAASCSGVGYDKLVEELKRA